MASAAVADELGGRVLRVIVLRVERERVRMTCPNTPINLNVNDDVPTPATGAVGTASITAKAGSSTFFGPSRLGNFLYMHM